MSNRGTSVKLALGIAVMVMSFSGCAKKSATAVNATSGGTFTGSDLNATWNSVCISSAGRITGSTYYKDSLTISGGNTFSYGRYVYTSSTCNYGAVGLASWNTSGTFTVGGIVSGSMQSITFTATASTIQPNNGGTVWMNNGANVNGCGAFTTGVTKNIFSNACVFNSLFTPCPANTVTENVASLSGGLLSIGVPTEGSPGVYVTQGQPLPTTVGLVFQ